MSLQVQASIGASRAVAFDLTAACSGFVVALVTGSQYIRAGTYRNVLVVGGDALSRFVDWRDRGGSNAALLLPQNQATESLYYGRTGSGGTQGEPK